MEYEKDPNKKPYKSALSNALWSFQQMLRNAPAALLFLLLQLPLAVFLAWSEVRLPALVVGEVTAGLSFQEAATAVGLMLGLMLAATAGRDIFVRLADNVLNIYWDIMGAELSRRSVRCFYQTFERKETRDMYDRAVLATQSWDGVQPLCDTPRRAVKLMEYVLCYALLGAVISGVSPWLVLLLTVAPAVNILCARSYRKWEYSIRAARTDNNAKLDYVIRTSGDYDYWKDIRVYGMAGWLRRLYDDLFKRDVGWGEKMRVRQLLMRLADLLVILLRDGAAYAVLIAQAIRGEVDAERFVLYFAAISSFAGFVGNIVSEWTGMNNASLFVSDFREYLDMPEDAPDGSETVEKHLPFAPEIVFDHVSFRYHGAEADTIHDLNLTIRAGEKLALVGLNGAGKTTLVKLICGLYAPTEGEIRLNGVPVQDFKREEYYKLFSPVFQDARAGCFTLAECVSGCVDGTGDKSRAEECIRRAGLGAKLDSLPMGVDTVLDKQLSAQGTELSGGETQKLMLARALYKDAPALVLDEPTAALDPIAENEVYLQYNAMAAGKTSVFISHRLASTRFCDRILFLQNGRIAEQGTHSELLALGGEYSRLFEIQSCWYRDDYKGGEAE